MKIYFFRRFSKTLSVAYILLAGISVYAQKTPVSEPVQGGLKLVYNYPSDRVVKYINITRVAQDMNIDGQSMLVNASTLMKCNVKMYEKTGENLKLEIKIDTMAQKLETPQSATGGEVTDAKYKVFFLTIASSGKAIDLSEAAKIILDIPGSGLSDASQSFLGFFPVIPANVVKPADTWFTHDTVNAKTPSMTNWMTIESNYTYEGTENYKGSECAKISATLSGIMKMTNKAQGMDIATSGTYTGTKTIYFAIKEGYFIKEIAATKITGTMDFTNQGMSFPVVMDITSNNEILR